MIGDLQLSVEVRNTSITVTMPGTNYAVTYSKPSAGPSHLVVTHEWTLVHMTTPPISDFRSRAFLAASAKARELGWNRAAMRTWGARLGTISLRPRGSGPASMLSATPLGRGARVVLGYRRIWNHEHNGTPQAGGSVC